MEIRDVMMMINLPLSGSRLDQDRMNVCATSGGENLGGFCCVGSATGFLAWRRQDGWFTWVLLSRTVDPRVRKLSKPLSVSGLSA
jgi:hypothetical protein